MEREPEKLRRSGALPDRSATLFQRCRNVNFLGSPNKADFNQLNMWTYSHLDMIRLGMVGGVGVLAF